MSDLVTWLRGVLDEDEAIANSATSGPWNNDDPMARDGVFAPAVDGFVADGMYERMGPFAVHNAAHIARHDPAAVLADIAAKRAVLDLHGDLMAGAVGRDPTCQTCQRWNEFIDGDGEWGAEAYPCPTVRMLASAYADRPGYRSEWRPE